jgi:hypothetical protein
MTFTPSNDSESDVETIVSYSRVPHTSSSFAISLRATTSIRTGWLGVMTNLTAALGVQEWLNNRLASGNIPWPMGVRWECSTKLLFPNLEYRSLSCSAEGGDTDDDRHMGGTLDLEDLKSDANIAKGDLRSSGGSSVHNCE